MSAPTNKIVIVPTKPTYLPLSQRALKSNQIGPSSHHNEYHSGVMIGNWVDSRAELTAKFVKAEMDCKTIYKASYAHPGKVTKRQLTPHTEMDRHLLFGHGDDFTAQTFMTTNEAFFTHPNERAEAVGEATMMDKTTGMKCARPASATTSRSDLLEKKRQKWEDEKDMSTRFKTTKNASIDTAGKIAQEQRLYEPTKSKAGQCVRSLDSDFHKMNLRSAQRAW